MSDTIRFGVYELDRKALELRKHGAPIRLQEQPLRVLAMLVAQPGQIVTREQLQKHIWGDNTFVDFDHSLNKAINRVREALDDSPGTPRYIETIPRRGYRFIAPVAEAGPVKSVNPAEPVVAAPVAEPAKARPQKTHSPALLASVLALVLAVSGVIAIVWLLHPTQHAFQEPKLIASFAWSPAISRDGKLIAYASGAGIVPPRIWLQQTAGGQPIPITSGSDAEGDSDFSPDGTRIVFITSKEKTGLYIEPALGGEARLLVASITAENPRFSPAGDRVLFWQDGKAFTISAEGGEPLDLAFNRDFEISAAPLWAPNGKELLFYGTRKREPGLAAQWWIAPLAEGQPRILHIPGIEQADQAMVQTWIRTTDERELIVFSTREVSATRPNGWALWQAGISSRGVFDQTPVLIASGVGNVTCAASADGKFVYRTQLFEGGIHQIQFNQRGESSDPVTQLPLPIAGWHTAPSLSRDGRWMAYNSRVPGNPDRTLLRDLNAGTEHLLDDQGALAYGRYPASISPDGTRVIVSRGCKQGTLPGDPTSPLPCDFIVGSEGGDQKQICESCIPRGFSSDGSVVLLEKYGPTAADRDHIATLNLRTGRENDFLSVANMDASYPFFSWDNKWVVFRKITRFEAPVAQIMIAPVRNGSAAGEGAWIEVTDGEHLDDKPQWAADGNTIYFTSTRDRYLCVWGQRLNPRTKRPVGEPFVLEHFHNEVGRTGFFAHFGCDLSVARDKALINLPRVQTQVWMTQLR